MVALFNVFALEDALQGNEPMWLGGAESFEKARELMSESGPGAYFLLAQHTQRKSFYEVESDGAVYPLALHSTALPQ